MPSLMKLAIAKNSRKYYLATFFGMLATLALPPSFFFPALFISFPGLFLLIEKCHYKKEAFFVGWWFGFGHFVTGFYWISFSLLVDLRFAWMIPFAVSLIPAAMAIYIGFTAMITSTLLHSGWRKIVLFSCIWVGMEFLRAYIFTGFPWNLIGYSWAFSDAMIQPASIFGIYGLSLLAVILATMPATLTKKQWKPVLAMFAIAAAFYIWGDMRLKKANYELTGINIRIVQPNIAQHLKWAPESKYQAFAKHLEISSIKTGFRPDVIVWPESSIPFILSRESRMRSVMAETLPEGSYLITGAVRTEGNEGTQKFWNSVQVLDDSGKIIAYYDKHHLVPFGEFVPLRSVFPFINKITPGNTDFSSGSGPQSIKLANIPPFSPLICYEAILSGYVADREDPPAWLLNVTNDGWFGLSSGPHQHFHMARIRAVEEGVPMVRAANTGISGLIDSYGRIIASLELGQEGSLDAVLPRALRGDNISIYRDYGEVIPIILIIILGFATSRKSPELID